MSASKVRLYQALLVLLAGCAEASSDLVVRVLSDLRPGDQINYLSAETLNEDGAQQAHVRWMRVDSTCVLGPDGRYDLGSFSVARARLPVARLRVTAYRDVVGRARRVVEQRLDVVLPDGKRQLDVVLTQACAGVSCAAAETCDPHSTSCTGPLATNATIPPTAVEDVPACLEQIPEVARDESIEPSTVSMDGGGGDVDAGADSGIFDGTVEPPPSHDSGVPGLCVGGDQHCGEGCTFTNDFECKFEQADPCFDNIQCRSGNYCVDGHCCDQLCTKDRERCDLPGYLGQCTPILCNSKDGPLTEPGFDGQCAPNVHYSCSAQSCTSRCESGFDDCDSDLQGSGCETPLGTIEHCSKCNDKCRYRGCSPERKCQGTLPLNYASATSTRAEPGVLYATLYIPSSDDLAVQALGVLVVASGAAATIRVAMYEADGGFPNNLVPDSEVEIPVEDAPGSPLPQQSGVLRVEAVLRRPVMIDRERTYYLALQVASSTIISGRPAFPRERAEVLSAPNLNETLPPIFPSTAARTAAPVLWSLYAITTPH